MISKLFSEIDFLIFFQIRNVGHPPIRDLFSDFFVGEVNKKNGSHVLCPVSICDTSKDKFHVVFVYPD